MKGCIDASDTRQHPSPGAWISPAYSRVLRSDKGSKCSRRKPRRTFSSRPAGRGDAADKFCHSARNRGKAATAGADQKKLERETEKEKRRRATGHTARHGARRLGTAARGPAKGARQAERRARAARASRSVPPAARRSGPLYSCASLPLDTVDRHGDLAVLLCCMHWAGTDCRMPPLPPSAFCSRLNLAAIPPNHRISL